MKKKDVLFLTTQLPYPPISGGTIKSYNLVLHLSRRYNLHLACLLKDDDEQHEKEFNERIKCSSYHSHPLNVQRRLWNLLKSYFLSSSFNTFRNRNGAFKSKVDSLANTMAAIVVDHYEMFQYVPEAYSGKIIFHTHNAEFLLWERMSALENNILKKLLLQLEAKRVKILEKSIINRSDVVFASPHDVSVYKRNGMGSLNFATTFHLGDDSLLGRDTIEFDNTEKALLFIGTLNWEPNVNGLLWFLGKVYPGLKEKHRDLLFYIVGGKVDDRLNKYADHDGVVFTGFVQELEKFYRKARVSVVPLQFGSGMKVKVLESMYRGIPIVSTTVGGEGIDVENGRDIYIADSPEAFIDHTSNLLEDKDKWTAFRDNSRKIAREKYTWKRLFQNMDKVFDKVLN